MENEREKNRKVSGSGTRIKENLEYESKSYTTGFGASGTTPPLLAKRLKDIGIGLRITELQKTAILYSARILQKVFEI